MIAAIQDGAIFDPSTTEAQIPHATTTVDNVPMQTKDVAIKQTADITVMNLSAVQKGALMNDPFNNTGVQPATVVSATQAGGDVTATITTANPNAPNTQWLKWIILGVVAYAVLKG